jgi:hypothetical protein
MESDAIDAIDDSAANLRDADGQNCHHKANRDIPENDPGP